MSGENDHSILIGEGQVGEVPSIFILILGSIGLLSLIAVLYTFLAYSSTRKFPGTIYVIVCCLMGTVVIFDMINAVRNLTGNSSSKPTLYTIFELVFSDFTFIMAMTHLFILAIQTLVSLVKSDYEPEKYQKYNFLAAIVNVLIQLAVFLIDLFIHHDRPATAFHNPDSLYQIIYMVSEIAMVIFIVTFLAIIMFTRREHYISWPVRVYMRRFIITLTFFSTCQIPLIIFNLITLFRVTIPNHTALHAITLIFRAPIPLIGLCTIRLTQKAIRDLVIRKNPKTFPPTATTAAGDTDSPDDGSLAQERLEMSPRDSYSSTESPLIGGTVVYDPIDRKKSDRTAYRQLILLVATMLENLRSFPYDERKEFKEQMKDLHQIIVTEQNDRVMDMIPMLRMDKKGNPKEVVFNLKVKGYAPGVFEMMRREDFVWRDQIISSLDPRKNQKQLVAAAKEEGSVIIFSHDNKYILKQISTDELAVLGRILIKSLQSYWVQNPDSLLCRLYGAFSVKSIGSRSVDQTYVLMENMCAVSDLAIDKIYELRALDDISQKFKSRKVRGQTKILTDFDFHSKQKKLPVSTKDAEAIKITLKRDLEFLAGLHITSYGILIVCMDFSKYSSNKEMIRNKSKSSNPRTFQHATNDNKFYSLSIIDLLRSDSLGVQYDKFSKQLGNADYLIINNASVDSERYAKKFSDLVDDIL